jgi:hypothetical protein
MPNGIKTEQLGTPNVVSYGMQQVCAVTIFLPSLNT